MRFDIVTLNTPYRGICRSLNTNDLLSKKAKSHYQKLLAYYFEYIDLMYSPGEIPYDSITFNKMLEYYLKFQSYNIDCEIIAYDNMPLTNIFGNEVELLGIDVVHEFAESLLENAQDIHDIIKNHLNSFGLCRKLVDINIVLKNSLCGDIDWTPCWVYKVNI